MDAKVTNEGAKDAFQGGLVGSINFEGSKAYNDALTRFKRLGISLEDAKKLIGESNV